jgi:hypothetical protein
MSVRIWATAGRAGFWIVVAAVVIAVLLFLFPLFPGRGTKIIDWLRGKAREEKAGLETAQTLAKEGAAVAKAEVVAKYSVQLEALNARQKVQADRLAQDPVSLARYLVKMGTRPAG